MNQHIQQLADYVDHLGKAKELAKKAEDIVCPSEGRVSPDDIARAAAVAAVAGVHAKLAEIQARSTPAPKAIRPAVGPGF